MIAAPEVVSWWTAKATKFTRIFTENK
jgi:hypothetical protein